MIQEQTESLFISALPTEQFVYLTYMLNKMKKKAKKKMTGEQFSIYIQTMDRHNEIFKVLQPDQEAITMILDQSQIYFLQFFTQSTAAQAPDPGQRKILNSLFDHFKNVKHVS